MERNAEVSSPASGAGAGTSSWESERVARREAEAVAQRLARLQGVTAALSVARTPDDVAAVALGAGLEALGAARGFVLVARPEGDLQVLRCAGVPEESARDAASGSVPGPALEAFRTGAPVFLDGASDLVARYPGLADEAGRTSGPVAALPLVVEGRALGALVVSFDGTRRLGEGDRAFALGLAGQLAQVLERARLLVAERNARADAVAARGRLAFLDGLSAHLSEAAERQEMLDGVAALAVPVLGEWAGVYLPNEAGGLALAAQHGAASIGAVVDAHLRRGAPARMERSCGCGDVAILDDVPADASGRPVPAVVVVPLGVRRRSLGAIAVAATDPARVPDVALLADVGHRTALALEHARLLEEATDSARAREEFLHVASHELRAPIATIQLTMHLLRRDARGLDPGGWDGRLRVLERQVARLLGVSDTLLDVSRIAAGRLELAREVGDLAALVREVAQRFEEEAGERGSVLEVDAPASIRCAYDATRMDQVLSNLLSNAVKYGRGGPVRVAARVEGSRGVLEVQDHGIGIAPEHQVRIFGRFERAVSSRSYPGLGLGLWIVRRLVEAHGGTILVRSAPGEGSTFTVELPLSEDAASPA